MCIESGARGKEFIEYLCWRSGFNPACVCVSQLYNRFASYGSNDMSVFECFIDNTEAVKVEHPSNFIVETLPA